MPQLKRLTLLPLAAVFLMAGCAEKPEDLARKPDIIAQMVENSASICEQGPPAKSGGPQYEERLRALLQAMRTTDLDVFQSKGITICLDQRLENQNLGYFSQGWPVSAVFYSNEAIVSISDNGKLPHPVDVGKRHYNTSYTNDLAYMLKTGEMAPGSGNWYADSYRVGKTASLRIYWGRDNSFKTALSKNPQLQQPPLQQPVAPK